MTKTQGFVFFGIIIIGLVISVFTLNKCAKKKEVVETPPAETPKVPETPDKPYIAPGVLRRIARASGWMARSSGSDPSDVRNDWAVVQEHLRSNGRDPATLTFGATQFLHVTDETATTKALVEQMPLFTAVMGDHRTADDLQASYLTGTVDDMQRTVAELAAAGLEYLILTPLVNDPGQLDLIVEHIVRPFS